MSQVGFEPMIPVFELPTTFYALDCTATVIGFISFTLVKMCQVLTHLEKQAFKKKVCYMLEYVLKKFWGIHSEMFLRILMNSPRFIFQSGLKFMFREK
jgi:hypothetical protein